MARDAIDAFIEGFSEDDEGRDQEPALSELAQTEIRRFEALRSSIIDPAARDAAKRLSAAGHELVVLPESSIPSRGQGEGMTFLFFPKGGERPSDLTGHFPRLTLAPMTNRGLVTVVHQTDKWEPNNELVYYDIVTPTFVTQHLANLCRWSHEAARRPKSGPTESHDGFAAAFSDIFSNQREAR